MDIKIIDDSGQEIKSEQNPIESEKNVSAPAIPELELKAMGQVLGVENDSEIGRNEDRLKTLLDYAKSQTDDHSLENLKWIVRSLELKIGTPPFGEDRLAYVARYAYLLSEESNINKEKAKFERK